MSVVGFSLESTSLQPKVLGWLGIVKAEGLYKSL